MIGFFDIAGLGGALTRYDGSRATGMFKDPNVLGPFLVLPSLLADPATAGRHGAAALREPGAASGSSASANCCRSRAARGATMCAGIVLVGGLGLLTVANAAAQRQRIVAHRARRRRR